MERQDGEGANEVPALMQLYNYYLTNLYISTWIISLCKKIISTPNYSYIEYTVHGADRAPAYHIFPVDVTGGVSWMDAPIFHHRSQLPSSYVSLHWGLSSPSPFSPFSTASPVSPVSLLSRLSNTSKRPKQKY